MMRKKEDFTEDEALVYDAVETLRAICSDIEAAENRPGGLSEDVRRNMHEARSCINQGIVRLMVPLVNRQFGGRKHERIN